MDNYLSAGESVTGGITRTGRWLWLTRPCETLPSTTVLIPLSPRDPVTINSASDESAYSSIRCQIESSDRSETGVDEPRFWFPGLPGRQRLGAPRSRRRRRHLAGVRRKSGRLVCSRSTARPKGRWLVVPPGSRIPSQARVVMASTHRSSRALASQTGRIHESVHPCFEPLSLVVGLAKIASVTPRRGCQWRACLWI